jgi:hypothetical protein
MLCVNIYIYDFLLNVVIMTFGSTKIDSNRRSFKHSDASNSCVLKRKEIRRFDQLVWVGSPYRLYSVSWIIFYLELFCRVVSTPASYPGGPGSNL